MADSKNKSYEMECGNMKVVIEKPPFLRKSPCQLEKKVA